MKDINNFHSNAVSLLMDNGGRGLSAKLKAASNREIPRHNKNRETFTETGLSQPETSKFSDLAVIMVTQNELNQMNEIIYTFTWTLQGNLQGPGKKPTFQNGFPQVPIGTIKKLRTT